MIKNYKTREEAKAAFIQSVKMRAEYEAKVRQQWQEMSTKQQTPQSC